MSKDEYIRELRSRIAHLPADEREAALTYYIEYLEELGEERIDEAIRELGTPKEVAERIIADYAQRSRENGEHRQMFSSGGNGCLIAGIAVLTSPIWLTLAVALLGVVIGLTIGLAAIVFALLLCAVLPFAVGVWALSYYVGTGLFLMGIGLAFAGLLLLLITGISSLFQLIGTLRTKWKKKRNAFRQEPPYYGPYNAGGAPPPDFRKPPQPGPNMPFVDDQKEGPPQV